MKRFFLGILLFINLGIYGAQASREVEEGESNWRKVASYFVDDQVKKVELTEEGRQCVLLTGDRDIALYNIEDDGTFRVGEPVTNFFGFEKKRHLEMKGLIPPKLFNRDSIKDISYLGKGVLAICTAENVYLKHVGIPTAGDTTLSWHEARKPLKVLGNSDGTLCFVADSVGQVELYDTRVKRRVTSWCHSECAEGGPSIQAMAWSLGEKSVGIVSADCHKMMVKLWDLRVGGSSFKGTVGSDRHSCPERCNIFFTGENKFCVSSGEDILEYDETEYAIFPNGRVIWKGKNSFSDSDYNSQENKYALAGSTAKSSVITAKLESEISVKEKVGNIDIGACYVKWMNDETLLVGEFPKEEELSSKIAFFKKEE